MRSWLLGIVLTSLAGGLARQLAPQGKEQAMVRLAGGLLLTLAILRPLAGREWAGAPLVLENLEWQTEAEAYRKNQREELSAIIEEKAEAYIWDKANRLGLACTVEVTAAAEGTPLPAAAVIRGPYSEALERCIEEEVGIPAEKLIWLEDDQWQTRKESES